MPLFHYCSNEAFTGILESNQVWLSDVSLSNDAMEGRWLKKLASDYAAAEGLMGNRAELFIKMITFISDLWGAVVLCLSEDGDVLSQWRGYAADGTGVSIGFSDEFLASVCKASERTSEWCVLRKVIYKKAEQLALVQNPFEDAVKKIKGGELDLIYETLLHDPNDGRKKKREAAEMEVFSKLANLSVNLHVLKNEAFSEEKEWRVISQIMGGPILNDEYKKLKFRAKGNRILPYRPLSLKGHEKSAIAQVFLGPKNITPPAIVAACLASYGFAGFTVENSKASYR